MAALRVLAWRGCITMAVRQVVGMAISFAGLVGLARLIGPQSYGIYVSALALYSFLVLFFQWGTDVFLMRRPEEPSDDHINQALTLTLVLGGLGVALSIPAGWLAERWIGAPGVARAVTILFCGMPLHLATLVPSALLQRRMAYRLVAWSELASHMALYGVALLAAWGHMGVTAPLVGWWAQQFVAACCLFPLSGLRPRLVWRWALLSELLNYGLGYSASVWIWQLRTLVNPLIVARMLGPEAAANVAVAVRLVDALSFMRMVLWRVAIPALGRVQADPERLRRAIIEGIHLQVLAVAPLMAVFAVVAPWLVPFSFGKDWSPVVVIFPFLALASLANSLFSLHSSALSVMGRNGDVAFFHAVHVTLLAVGAAILVPIWGLKGYGLAEAMPLIAYLLLQARAERVLGPVKMALPLVWALGFALPLFTERLGPESWLGPVVVLILPATRRVLATWWAQMKETAHG